MTINKALKEYLNYRLINHMPFISSHEFEDARDYIKEKTGNRHNVSTIERAWRKMRENGDIQTINATIPRSREKTWKIIKVNTT